MITRLLFVAVPLLLLGTFQAPGIHGKASDSLGLTGVEGCSACRIHEEIRAQSLEAIKEQILNKLGLKQAPNMTGRALPRIPPINKLMDMYGMQSDQPQPLEPGITHHEELDEFAAKTETVIALAQPRKLDFQITFKFARKVRVCLRRETYQNYEIRARTLDSEINFIDRKWYWQFKLNFCLNG